MVFSRCSDHPRPSTPRPLSQVTLHLGWSPPTWKPCIFPLFYRLEQSSRQSVAKPFAFFSHCPFCLLFFFFVRYAPVQWVLPAPPRGLDPPVPTTKTTTTTSAYSLVLLHPYLPPAYLLLPCVAVRLIAAVLHPRRWRQPSIGVPSRTVTTTL
ncbi:hypothetical protein F4861DRAFT_182408 [Xylaria intraflava]|nr:hypothetical protein F4861DRAFT_182408 [Xylaria intraflava]